MQHSTLNALRPVEVTYTAATAVPAAREVLSFLNGGRDGGPGFGLARECGHRIVAARGFATDAMSVHDQNDIAAADMASGGRGVHFYPNVAEDLGSGVSAVTLVRVLSVCAVALPGESGTSLVCRSAEMDARAAAGRPATLRIIDAPRCHSHHLWVLEQPLELTDDADRRTMDACNRELGAVLGLGWSCPALGDALPLPGSCTVDKTGRATMEVRAMQIGERVQIRTVADYQRLVADLIAAATLIGPHRGLAWSTHLARLIADLKQIESQEQIMNGAR